MKTQTEVLRIIDQLNRLYSGHCWLGYNIPEILDCITPAQANRSFPGFSNTIHQIVRHVLATEFVVLKRLEGIDYELSPQEDWMPTPEISKLDWIDSIRQLHDSSKKLETILQTVTDDQLDRPIIKDYSTVYVTLHGHIQHTAYHFGQVMLLKRLSAEQLRPEEVHP